MQTITQFGIFDDEFMPIGTGNYLTTAAHGVKRCPKASSITGMVPVYTDSSGLVRSGHLHQTIHTSK
jgi:hypothetical protein